MKKFLLFISIAVFLIQNAYPQPKKATGSFKLFISLGYGNTESSSLTSFYNSIIDNYRLAGVPVSTQRKFGPTLLANAGLLYMYEKFGAGISLDYLYSPAFSNYKDYAGAVKIKGSVTSYEIMLFGQYSIGTIGIFPIYIKPQIGFCHAALLITNDINFNDYPQFNNNQKISISGYGPSFQITLGTNVDLKDYFIGFEVGYRFTRVPVSNSTIILDTQTGQTPDDLDIGEKGLISLISFGFKL